jgi:SAM-dependent methyltransferase
MRTNEDLMRDSLISSRFPRSNRYHPDWILSTVSGGANSLWMTEWLTEAMDLRPGMRVLDLGCGMASSSIFLSREFGLQVWATDLWISANGNRKRIEDAGCAESVFPIHAEARALPFAAEFFDAITCIDAYPYFGTDDLYLATLSRYVKPGGQIGIAGAGLMREIEGEPPEHLREWWEPEPALWALHSAGWWRRHWEKPGYVKVETADTLENGWKYWLDWHHVVAPNNAVEIAALEADAGQYLGYVRVIGRRKEDAVLEEPITSLPEGEVVSHPLLRATTQDES